MLNSYIGNPSGLDASNIDNNTPENKFNVDTEACAAKAYPSQQMLLNTAVLDSFAEVTFKTPQYCKDLVYHLLGYISLPLMIRNEGFWGATNRYFLFHKDMFKSDNYIPILLFQIMYTVCHVISTILFFYTDGILLYEFVFFQVFYILRCSVISAKYAYMPSVLLQRIRTRPEIGRTHANYQIIAGWVNPSADVIWNELNNAAIRKNVNLSQSHVIFYGTLKEARIVMKLASEAKAKLGLGPVEITPLKPTEMHLVIRDPSQNQKISQLSQNQGSLLSNITNSLVYAHGTNELNSLGESVLEQSVSVGSKSSPNLGFTADDDESLSAESIETETTEMTKIYGKFGNSETTECHFKLSVGDFLFQILLDARRSSSRHSYKILLGVASLVALLVCATPIGYRLWMGHSFSDWKLLFILFSFTWIEWLSISNNIQFIVGAMNDYWRRYYVRRSLLSLFSSNGYTRTYLKNDFEYNPDEKEPSIHFELSYPGNLSYWPLFKEITHDFGIVYFNRIQFFTGQFTLLIFAASIFLAYSAIFDSTIHWIPMSQLLILFPIFGIYLGLCLRPAAQTNAMTVRELSLVSSAQLMLRTMHSINFISAHIKIQDSVTNAGSSGIFFGNLSSHQIQQLTLCDKLLDAVSSSIVSMEAENPITLLGIKASPNIAQSLLSIAAGGFIIIVRQLFF